MLKAVIPVAGLGTRMLPATKAIPKEMLPIVDKPLIQYIVEECYASGIREIIFVTHSSKNAIENHFDTSFELESILESRVKRQLLEEIRSICPADMKIMHIRQGHSKGLGHAVLSAYPLVGHNDFIVILPDVLIDNLSCDFQQDNLSAMIARFGATGISQVMVEQVPQDEVSSYGIVDCGNARQEPGTSIPITGIIEKPSRENAPSNLAVVGRYVLCADIWPLLKSTPFGAGNEIQLTDAISVLMNQSPVESYCMLGRSHDCGNKIGYLKAFVEYGMRHTILGTEFSHWLEECMIAQNA
ncbi:UTP--glucose-1-phosphate uridylyltransferase GalU [Acerihabitans sp. TG2]|uniref:UTP--glucose-1-phosphate uridylyltransferase GalU n=1 Tax=Acerihabitans sp. TG2 TaxID=3096008 RepID=UPI002B238F55|nr:UTP--glucose-1-phosphate uridylyltransferase GalU [Acerihabitans sp. TG2]MEA9389003.1 UTP--glucose-1-phosphate uridylyltransferase GalU [Acerihabitans sp. TG2]